MLNSSTDTVIVGSSITFNCSTDLNPISIEWYRGDFFISQEDSDTTSELTVDRISTEDHGIVYTCKTVFNNGFQTRDIDLSVEGIKNN